MPDNTALPLANANLGDIVTLPDGRTRTIRARTSLGTPIASIAGFMILGEFESVVATPARAGDPLLFYVPSSSPTFDESSYPRQRAEGSLSYWAPHLPPLANAMGEVLYRVVLVAGSVDPHLIVYRSNEPIYFVKSSEVDPSLIFLRRLAGAAESGPTDLRQAWSVQPRRHPYDESSEVILDAPTDQAPSDDGLYTRMMRT